MAQKEPIIELDLDKVEDAGARGHALEFPRTWISDRIEAVLEGIGGLINWLWIVLVLIIVGTVLMRHFVGGNTIGIEETQWHLYAIGYMLGVGYALKHDAHVRVDVLAMSFRRRTRAVIEILGILLLILPMILVLIPEAVNFTVASLRNNEISPSPGGLTNRWAIKGVIVIALVYLGLAALARLIRVVAFLYESYGGRPLGRPVQLAVNAVLAVAVVAVVVTPGWRIYAGAAPPARDVERLVAQHYDLRRIRTESVSCRGALPFSFQRVQPTETTVWAKPWRCTIVGLELPGVDGERRAFGAEIVEGTAITGEVLVGWLFPRGGRRSAYVLMSNPDEAEVRPDLSRLGANG
jgi:TRAP-type mannitol/chloroaromatic compound transport system permease small subunit